MSEIQKLFNLIYIKNNKVKKILNIMIMIAALIDIIAIIFIYIYLKLYMSHTILFIGKELITLSNVIVSCSIIYSIVFSNYFLKD